MNEHPRWNAPPGLPKQMAIGGQHVEASRRRRMETIDPALGRAFADVPQADAEDVDRAVASAKQALVGPWRSVSPAERGCILVRTAALVRREQDRFARIETLDSGKPLRKSLVDVETTAAYFEYYAGIADKLQGDTIPLGRDYISFTLHEPVGVTAHIIPWNFPLVTAARGIAPALAAGNTAVVKPLSRRRSPPSCSPISSRRAGLPAGVYNVVTGFGEEPGAPLCAHPDVAHVTFTGSVATGKTVMKLAADHVASVTLELGGKSADY